MADDIPAPVKPSWRRRHWKKFMLLAVILIPILAFSGWAWFTLNYTYSHGDRAGYVQKLSKKGWLCKTWEGELAMANLPGAMPQIFKFTVKNDSIARLLEKSLGKQVSITYDEHKGIPTSCFGETMYYITNVRPVQP